MAKRRKAVSKKKIHHRVKEQVATWPAYVKKITMVAVLIIAIFGAGAAVKGLHDYFAKTKDVEASAKKTEQRFEQLQKFQIKNTLTVELRFIKSDIKTKKCRKLPRNATEDRRSTCEDLLLDEKDIREELKLIREERSRKK